MVIWSEELTVSKGFIELRQMTPCFCLLSSFTLSCDYNTLYHYSKLVRLQLWRCQQIIWQKIITYQMLGSLKIICNFSRILTGIQPTGALTIGNYLGSVQNLLDIQKKHADAQTYVFIADLHSLTTAFDLQHAQIKFDDKIGLNTLHIAKNVISSGFHINKGSHLFVQSEVKEHAQLCWLLGCIGPQHWLNMMIQYKQKSTKNSSLGIYSYPVLMTADIILYKANFVPVGEDQKQHLQLAKKYAERFNSIVHKQFFPIPQYIVSKAPRVLSLTNPEKKMSKSDANERSRINMTDSKDQIAEKIRRAVTDSDGNSITYDAENRKGLSNLIRIYSSLNNLGIDESVAQFKGQGMKQFKNAVIETIARRLGQIQRKMNELSDEETRRILRKGADEARVQAEKTVKEVKQLLKLYK